MDRVISELIAILFDSVKLISLYSLVMVGVCLMVFNQSLAVQVYRIFKLLHFVCTN